MANCLKTSGEKTTLLDWRPIMCASEMSRAVKEKVTA